MKTSFLKALFSIKKENLHKVFIFAGIKIKISIYHNASDFFDIKPLLESWNLNYSFKIVRPVDMGIQCETLLIAEQLEDFNNE